MKIIDPAMVKKMDRALKCGGNLYTLADIADSLQKGTMQSHVIGDTWVITQINQFPRRKTVDVMYVVGNLDEALQIEHVVGDWAKDQGADLLTFTGRDGWWEHRTPGWKKVGTVYAKEI